MGNIQNFISEERRKLYYKFYQVKFQKSLEHLDDPALQLAIIMDEIKTADLKTKKQAYLFGLDIDEELIIENIDFYEMIREFEQKRFSFQNSDLKNIAKRLMKNRLQNPENKELYKKIEQAYDHYREENDIFTLNDFVNFYNAKYQDDVSSLLGISSPILLTDSIVRAYFQDDFSLLPLTDLLRNTDSEKTVVEELQNNYAQQLKEEKKKVQEKERFLYRYDMKYQTTEDALIDYLTSLTPGKPRISTEVIKKLMRVKKNQQIDYDKILEIMKNQFAMELENAEVEDFDDILLRYREYMRVLDINKGHYRCHLRDFADIMNKVIVHKQEQSALPFMKQCAEVINRSKNLYGLYRYSGIQELYKKFRAGFDPIILSDDTVFEIAIKQAPELKEQIECIQTRFLQDKQLFLEKEERNRTENIAKQSMDVSFAVEAPVLVQSFIKSKIGSKTLFCTKTNIDPQHFNNCLYYIKEHDPKLSEEYETKKRYQYAIVLGNAKSIVNKIMNGVANEDGSYREFTYLDYKLATKNSFEVFLDLVSKIPDITQEQIRAAKTFAAKNKDIIYMNKQTFMDMKYSYKKTDGTIYTASPEDKEVVLEYIKNNGLDQEVKLLKQILRGYILGEIDITSEFEKSTDKVLSLGTYPTQIA